MEQPVGEVSLLLQRIGEGEPEAADSLLRLLYDELHRIAHAMMREQPPGHTLQTTALIGEAYGRLFANVEPSFNDRSHFLRSAAKAMRCALVDHARKKHAAKRGGALEPQPLDDVVAAYEERAIDLVAVHEALERLEAIDPELQRIVDLRFFAGLGNEEIAEVLGISSRSVQRGWNAARVWLGAALASDEPE